MTILPSDSKTLLAEIRKFISLAPAARAAGVGHASESGNENATNHEIFTKFLAKVSATKLFELLGQSISENDDSKFELVSTAIRYLLESQVGTEVINNPEFTAAVVGGLTHFDERVRTLTSGLLVRNVYSSRPEILQSKEVLMSVEKLVADSSVTVSRTASRIIEKVLANSNSELRIASLTRLASLSKSVDPESADVADPSTTEIRVLDLACSVASGGEEATRDCLSCSVLDSLFRLMASDDVLVKLNIIHLVPVLGSTQAGFAQVETSVLPQLVQLAGVADKGASADAFIGVEALRAVAPLCGQALRFQGAGEYRDLVDGLLKTLEAGLRSQDPQWLIAATEAVGKFAGEGGKAGMEFVLSCKELVGAWLALVDHMNIPVKAMALHSIAQALKSGSCLVDEDPSETFGDGVVAATPRVVQRSSEEDRIADALAGKMLLVALGMAQGGDPVGALVKLVQSPFEEVYVGALAVLRMVASQDAEWGLKALFTHPEFVKVTLDRSLHLSKVGLEWRFSVADAAMRNPNNGCVAGLGVLEKLREFLVRGPYLGPSAAPEVKVGESAS